MICPYCGSENGREDEGHEYLGQSDHKYLTVRLLGRRCSNCGHDYTIRQQAVARHWTRPRPEDFTGDLFDDTDSVDSQKRGNQSSPQ